LTSQVTTTRTSASAPTV